jgi:cytoskeletal protein RodZ
VGTILREARQQRGLSQEKLAQLTRLTTSTLQLIERGSFDKLPGGLYTRAYLRMYAKEVGLDPARIVARYLEQFPDRVADELPVLRTNPVDEQGNTGRLLLLEALAIVVALGVYNLLPSSDSSPPSPEQLAGSELVETALGQPTLTDTIGQTPVPVPVSGLDQNLRLEIRPEGACWVSAAADGQVVVYRLLQQGDSAIATATDEIVLRIGDPATFVYWLNGVPGRQLGRSGEAITVRITRENLESFLAEPLPLENQRRET